MEEREIHESEQYVTIPVDGVELEGDLAVPKGAKALVLFAHGSGKNLPAAVRRHDHGVRRRPAGPAHLRGG